MQRETERWREMERQRGREIDRFIERGWMIQYENRAFCQTQVHFGLSTCLTIVKFK